MEQLLAQMQTFFEGTSVWVYVFIFVGRMFDVSAATLRIVLVNRGERVVGSVVAFFEILVWMFVANVVLKSGMTDPLKILVYAVAFSLGTFVGSWLDDKLALGLCSIHVVVSGAEQAQQVHKQLHDNGFGVTALNVHGTDDAQRYMFITTVRRKTVAEAVKLVNIICPDAVITISDVKTQKGGFMRSAALPRR